MMGEYTISGFDTFGSRVEEVERSFAYCAEGEENSSEGHCGASEVEG